MISPWIIGAVWFGAGVVLSAIVSVQYWGEGRKGRAVWEALFAPVWLYMALWCLEMATRR